MAEAGRLNSARQHMTDIDRLEQETLAKIHAANSEGELEAVRLAALGKKRRNLRLIGDARQNVAR